MMVREYTNNLLELMNGGHLNAEDIVMACVNYMSEDDVKDMCECNGFDEAMLLDEEDEETEE